MIYCDTSFLISLYIADKNSAAAQEKLRDLREPLVWTPWHEMETRTALAARVGRKLLTEPELSEISSKIQNHKEPGGFYKEKHVQWLKAITHAGDLGADYGALLMNRSLDVLHVAICLQLEVDRFWSFDVRQNLLAEKVGLNLE